MIKTEYEILQRNNELFLFAEESKKMIYTSFWFLDFGKICAEVKSVNETNLYSITKKFKFWKWKMVYSIRNRSNGSFEFISRNCKRTIFETEKLENRFELRVHYKHKKSIYKNNNKIAEFDESVFSNENRIKLLMSDTCEKEIIFLLYVCFLMGNNNLEEKAVLKSQKELEKNLDPWY